MIQKRAKWFIGCIVIMFVITVSASCGTMQNESSDTEGQETESAAQKDGEVAAEGDALAQEAMELFQSGDAEAAMKKAQESVDAGSLAAKEIVCEGYFNNPSANPEEAFSWYQKCADLGGARGYRMVGIAYLNGNGVDQDYEQALSNLKKAYKLGDMKAPRYLGEIYRDGLGVEKDLDKALKFYRAAAETGDITATYELAKIDIDLYGTEESCREAYEYLKKCADDEKNAANDRVIPVAVELAKLYESGRGIPDEDRDAAAEFADKYYRLAASFDEETATSKDGSETDAYRAAKEYVESHPDTEQ